LARLIALSFLILPLVEIALFVVVGRAIGVLPTLALVILAAVIGALLLRQQGLQAITRLRNNVNAGTIPGWTMFDAMLIGLAAILLILPGFLSDIAALVLLVPPVRGWLFTALAGRVTVVETTTTYRRYDPSGGGSTTDQQSEIKAIDLKDEDWRDERK
jgi:UPF0716 protein FxsA